MKTPQFNKWKSESSKLFERDADFSEHCDLFNKSFDSSEVPVIWHPDNQAPSNLSLWLQEKGINHYNEFYSWSVNNRSDFWSEFISRSGLSEFLNHNDKIFDGTANKPLWLPEAKFNVCDLIFRHPENSIAILEGSELEPHPKSITYAELLDMTLGYASSIKKSGISNESRCGMFLPFSSESVAILLALIYVGAEPVLIPDSFSLAEVMKRCEIAECQNIITQSSYSYAGKTISPYEKIKGASELNILVLKKDDDIDLRSSHRQLEPRHEYITEGVKKSSDEIISILFSSGTTKDPKAIVWSNTTPLKCAMDGFVHQDIKQGDVVTWTTGMGWMMAPWLIYASLINGATMALYQGSYATSEYAEFLESSKISVLGTIPSLVKSWRKSGVLEERDLSIKLFSSTGEPSSQIDSLYLMYLTKYSAPVIEYCGGTEIGGGYITGSVLLPSAPGYFNTPACGLSLLFTTEEGQLSNEGEVRIVPPSIGLSTQLLNYDHDQEYYETIEGQIVRKHGDAFEVIESDGITFYKSQGRSDDSMNLGGIKTGSLVIENLVNQHPDVVESCAVSFQSEEDGPAALAIFYVGNYNDELLRILNSEIAKGINPLFRISRLIRKEALPRTASNKLMRRVLRDELSDSKN